MPDQFAHLDEPTANEYRRALRSMDTEWQGPKQLPCRIDYYDSLTEIYQLTERRIVPLMQGNQIRGSRPEYRLKPQTN